MIYTIEVLEKTKDERNFKVVSRIKNNNKKNSLELLENKKLTKKHNQKIRVVEYHNDDPDKIRVPCKIIKEY